MILQSRLDEVAAYLDDVPRVALPSVVKHLGELKNINRLRVMVDGARPGIDENQRWTERDLRALREKLLTLRPRRIAVTVVMWAAANTDTIEDIRRLGPGLVQSAGADSIEFDLEGAGHWAPKHVDGFASFKAAGAALLEAAQEVREQCGFFDDHQERIRIEGSTFPGHIELTDSGSFLRFCDVANVQVYPVAQVKRDGEWKPVAWSSALGPTRRVKSGMRLAVRRLPGVELTAALPAWRQNWILPKRPPEDAMFAALSAWEQVRADHPDRIPPRISYWSWKWLTRLNQRDPYARRFVRERLSLHRSGDVRS